MKIIPFIYLGAKHMVTGYDHILFVAALTVAYRPGDWRRLLVLVTAFTLGHSVTLALATLRLVRVDARSVEAAIAATIVCTALLTVAMTVRAPAEGPAAGPARNQGLRYALALGFGLIHGLGFSSFLRSLLGDEASLFLPLLSFNLGLEVGQLGIVLLVLVAGLAAERVAGLVRRDWVLIASGGIAAVGAKILVERLVG